jgi:hypothetical protein
MVGGACLRRVSRPGVQRHREFDLQRTTHATATLVGVNGSWVIVPVSVPLVLALLAWVGLRMRCSLGSPAGTLLAWVAIGVLALFAVVAGLSIGPYLLPAVLLLVAGAANASREEDSGLVRYLLMGLFVTGAFALAAGAVNAIASGKSVPAGTFSGCPRHVLPLPGSAASYAPTVRKVVLRFVATTFAPTSKRPKKLGGARTTGVLLVRHWFPSGWIKSECGRSVWERSIAVQVYFPALDLPHNPIGHCNDCARLMFVASRTSTGWTVWGEY